MGRFRLFLAYGLVPLSDAGELEVRPGLRAAGTGSATAVQRRCSKCTMELPKRRAVNTNLRGEFAIDSPFGTQ